MRPALPMARLRQDSFVRGATISAMDSRVRGNDGVFSMRIAFSGAGVAATILSKEGRESESAPPSRMPSFPRTRQSVQLPARLARSQPFRRGTPP
jgi:hypothetical protein